MTMNKYEKLQLTRLTYENENLVNRLASAIRQLNTAQREVEILRAKLNLTDDERDEVHREAMKDE